MSAASMAATSRPMRPMGRKVASQVGMAVEAGDARGPRRQGVEGGDAPEPGIRKRHTKKKDVPRVDLLAGAASLAAITRWMVVCQVSTAARFRQALNST